VSLWCSRERTTERERRSQLSVDLAQRVYPNRTRVNTTCISHTGHGHLMRANRSAGTGRERPRHAAPFHARQDGRAARRALGDFRSRCVSSHAGNARLRSWSGRAGELHRGGAALLFVTFAEVPFSDAVAAGASSADVCDLYMRMPPKRQVRSLPLWTIGESAVSAAQGDRIPIGVAEAGLGAPVPIAPVWNALPLRDGLSSRPRLATQRCPSSSAA
jgi:hypothetical protein